FLNIFLVVTGLQNRVFEASLIDLFAGLFSFVIFPFYAINVALLLLVKNTRFFVLAVFFLVFMSFSVSMFGYGGLNYYRYAIEFFGISIFIAAFQINLAFKRFAWFANFLIMVFIFSFFNPFMPLLNKILFSFSAIPSLLIDPLFPENAFILVLFFLVQIGLAYYLARFVVKKSLFSFFSKPLQLMLFLMVFNMFSMFYLLFAMGRFGFNIMFYNIPNFFDSIQFFLGLFF
ncbi:MAG: hypothetical protein Q7K34_00750, partial [archaeon]|nr:hypothetical protein [archaeon]